MFPNLYYVIEGLTGWSPPEFFRVIQTFGLLMGIAFLVADYFLYLELRRKTREGLIAPTKRVTWIGKGPTFNDLIGPLILGFILGFKGVYAYLNYSTFVNNPQEVILSGLGSFPGGIIVAALFAGYKWWQLKRSQLEQPKKIEELVYAHQQTGDFVVICAIAGVVGAKLFSVFETWEAFLNDPAGVFFSGSGLNFYGGFIVAAFVGIWYARKLNIKPLYLMDAVAPALMIGYGVGRLGCHFSGDGDWGIENTNPMPAWLSFLPEWVWAYDYPNNVIREGVPIEGCETTYCFRLDPPVYPTPIYETAMAIVITGFLWLMRRRIKIHGVIFFMYLSLQAVERFLIEKIRVNERYNVFGIDSTQAEFIAVLLFLTGIAGMIYLYNNHRKKQKVSA